MTVVHLPVYDDNAYQRLLMDAQRQLGMVTINGGGGGNFFRTALTRWKADVLHFHWLHPYLIRPSAAGTLLRSLRLMVELLLLKLSGQRIIWTVHNLKNHDNRHAGMERWFTKLFVRMTSAVIAHSPHAGSEAAAAFGVRNTQRIHIVPHGNYVGCYPDHVSGRAARQQLGLSPDSFVFLFLGRIQPYKGVLELIRQFKTLPSPAQLIIAGKTGDSVSSELIRNEIGDATNILFRPGFVPDSEIQIYMNACDAVVFPYRDVLTSGAVVLAMSFGRACVAPGIGGLTDTLDDRGAIFYDPSAPSGLKRALRVALDRRDESVRMGEHNRQLAEQWTWNRVAEMTRGIYETP
jgi:beta-1,4-mannosyltransferase